MTPPLNKKQEEILKKVYYEDKFLFGRDKLFAHLRDNYPEYKVSKRQVMVWLKNQEVYQINYTPPLNTSIKRFNASTPGYIQIDLIDMSNNPEKGFFWILTAVDIFSKKAVALPLKQKSQASTVKVMDKLLDFYDVISVIQTDNGKEFDLPQFYDTYSIKHLTSKAYTPQSQGIVERFNGTIKRLIAKNQEITGKKTWIADLPTLINNYNNSIHDITKATPDNVQINDVEVKKKLQNVKTSAVQMRMRKIEEILDVGSKVRVKLVKTSFDKKAANNYTKTIYTIFKKTIPKEKFNTIQYKLKDSEGDLVDGTYNASQIIPVEFSNDIKLA
jgi:hypothetical protein